MLPANQWAHRRAIAALGLSRGVAFTIGRAAEFKKQTLRYPYYDAPCLPSREDQDGVKLPHHGSPAASRPRPRENPPSGNPPRSRLSLLINPVALTLVTDSPLLALHLKLKGIGLTAGLVRRNLAGDINYQEVAVLLPL